MLRPGHRLRRRRIDHGDACNQVHMLLHSELGEMIIRLANLLTQRCGANHLRHMAVIFV